MQRDIDSFPCKCGGTMKSVDPTIKEVEKYNTCGRIYNCCAVAFQCTKCEWRYACTQDAPEAGW